MQKCTQSKVMNFKQYSENSSQAVNDIDNYIMEESGFDWNKPFIDWSDVEPVYDWFKECLTQ